MPSDPRSAAASGLGPRRPKQPNTAPPSAEPPEFPRWSDSDILALRGPKNKLDPDQPYAYFAEREFSAQGFVEDVAVILLTNRECPFHCLMCDLWRNTLDERVPVGAITRQIDFALSQLPTVTSAKLYNSGNFFDRKAIPPEEHPSIAERLQGLRTIVVESHPLLCGEACVRFRDRLPNDTELEIAIGLETVHPDVLARLNKQMTVDDFERAVQWLGERDIPSRAFVLLRPPLLSEAEGIEWALCSLATAFAAGVRCASIIPTRDGNGIMEQLRREGHFETPQLRSLELVMETALTSFRGRVFADLWDAERLRGCAACRPARLSRLREMNLTQRVPPPISCGCKADA